MALSSLLFPLALAISRVRSNASSMATPHLAANKKTDMGISVKGRPATDEKLRSHIERAIAPTPKLKEKEAFLDAPYNTFITTLRLLKKSLSISAKN
jgi:hypothetical protein